MFNIKQGDCLELMKSIPDSSIDLTVTSPPYDNLRTYENSIEWNFKIFTRIARELYRVTKDGGVVVWVVGDATINGSESGNSFRQALFFKRIGFNLHDTMIYFTPKMVMTHNRYEQEFEYMFVFSKGRPSTFNPFKIKCNKSGENKRYNYGQLTEAKKEKNDVQRYRDYSRPVSEYKIKGNVWRIESGFNKTTQDSYAFEHPAIFPESLANDHILSWSNEGDTVLDPFLGSGTTGKMAIRNNRKFIGFEKVEKYFKIAEKRIQDEIEKTALFNVA